MNRFWKSMIGLIALVLFTGATINGQLIRAQLENLSSDPTGSTARVYYNTASNQPKIYNGTAWTSLGGSGNGEKNYITNGSSSATGWTASSGGATIATDTNTADLPDISVGSALLITAVSGSNAFTFYNFTLDPADYNKKLKTTFDQACGFSTASTAAIVSCASNDFKVDVYSCTVAWSGSPATTCSGTSTRLALSTDPSGSTVSALPALTGTYRTTFDSPGSAAQYLQLRIGMNATQTHAIALANVLVGPGIVTQGAAVTGWTSYSPTVGGAPAADVQQYFYRRVGDAVQIQAYVHFTGAGTSTALTFTLPLSLTGNTSAIGGTSTAAGLIGNATIWNGTAVAQYQPQMTGSNATTFGFTNSSASAFQANAIASGYQISFDITVPVNEWAGAGTVNVVQNDVSYAYNTSGITAAGASDTTSFGYGPAGAAIGSITSTSGPAVTTMRVQYPTSIQVTDQIVLEVDSGTSGAQWVPVNGSSIAPFTILNTTRYGAGFDIVDSTHVEVIFGNGGRLTNGSTYGANAASPWSDIAAWKWRLKKFTGGQAVGFSQATTNAAGLVPAGTLDASQNWTLGPAANSAVSTLVQGNDTTNGTLHVKTSAASSQIQLERTTSSIGSVWLGSAGGDFRVGTTSGGSNLFQVTPSAGAVILGTTNGTAASSGNLGYIASSTLGFTQVLGTGVTGDSGVVNIGSFTLAAGDYLCWANCELNSSGSGVYSAFQCGIATTNSAFNKSVLNAFTGQAGSSLTSSGINNYLPTAPTHFSPATSTTYYGNMQVTATSNSGTTNGSIGITCLTTH